MRRTSASCSAETMTSIVVVKVVSRRTISARSSLNAAEYSSGSTPIGWYPADQTCPVRISLRKIYEPKSSHVGSSRQRVTAISPQRL